MRCVSESEIYKNRLSEMKHEIHETLADLSRDLNASSAIATRSFNKILSIINQPVQQKYCR